MYIFVWCWFCYIDSELSISRDCRTDLENAYTAQNSLHSNRSDSVHCGLTRYGLLTCVCFLSPRRRFYLWFSFFINQMWSIGTKYFIARTVLDSSFSFFCIRRLTDCRSDSVWKLGYLSQSTTSDSNCPAWLFFSK